MGLFGPTRINSGIVSPAIVVERKEEEMLHRMHSQMQAQLSREQREIVQERNIFKLIQQAESENSKLRNILGIVRAMLLKEDVLNKEPLDNVLERGRIHLEIAKLGAQITHDETQVEKMVLDLEKKINYIKNLASALSAEKQQDSKIDTFLVQWTQGMTNSLEEIKRDVLREHQSRKMGSELKAAALKKHAA